MKLEDNFKLSCEKKFLKTLNSITFDDEGDYTLDASRNNLTELKNEVLKSKEIAQYLESVEISLYFMDTLSEIQNSRKHKNKSFREICDQTEQDLISKKFSSFLEGLPYEHCFYISLPFHLPTGVNEIIVTDNLKIVRDVKEEKEKKEIIVEAFGGKLLPDENPNISVVIKSFGFETSAQIEAFSQLKHFLYLGLSSRLFEYNSYNTAKKGFRPNVSYTRPTREGNAQKFRSSLPGNTEMFLSKITLKKDAYNKIKNPLLQLVDSQKSEPITQPHDESFLDYIRPYRQMHSPTIKEEKHHIEAALEWGFEGIANENDTFGFIQTCIGLESLLGDDDFEKDEQIEKRGITDMLSDRCAHLLGATREDRKRIYKEFKEIYKLRSKLVHGRKPHISSREWQISRTARDYLKRLITGEIQRLHDSYSQRST